jgi:serine/threonine-protein kinase
MIGHYEILSVAGAGGMGKVYRARDTKLGRDVAVKVLRPEFSKDHERIRRSEREAKLLASLNHPNIAAIYDLEESEGLLCLVLEFVEGQTLAERLKRGRLPTKEVLKIGRQIAEALESAHERRIIHRDLKPGNVMVTPDGKVKVLDFGIAKMLESSASQGSQSQSDSLSAGVVLGTASYMSPEQARGQAVDAQSDIWAFGCVTYEMLTGKQTFGGDTVSDILAAVLSREPDFSQLPQPINPRLRDTLRSCLEKNRKERWQAIGDVRVEIQHILADPIGLTTSTGAAVPGSKQKRFRILPWAAASLILGALGGWLMKPMPLTEPRSVIRFDYEASEGQTLRTPGRPVIALSPDGRHFVYNTVRGLYLRSMETLSAKLIPGTEANLTNPFFSPNAEWVGYFATGTNELKKIAVGGGVAVTLCKATNPFGVSWNADGTILFGQQDGIWRVSQDGGEPKLVIPTTEELAYGPEMLPDGENILFSVTSVAGEKRWDRAQIVTQSLKSGKRKVLVQGGSDAHYASSGQLIYAVGNVLFAVPFDLKKLEVLGGPVPLVQDVQRAWPAANTTASANYGVSNRGTLVYLAARQEPNAVQDLALVDRNGNFERLNLPPAQYRDPRVSRDGKRLTVETLGQNEQDIIWVYDLAGTSAIRRLTPEGANYTHPIWGPDSNRITFFSDREKRPGIYLQLVDGSSLPERLTDAENGETQLPESWSPDRKTLSLAVTPRGTKAGDGWKLWTLSRDGKSKQQLLHDIPGSQYGSAFSPNGNWIAYTLSEGGPFGTTGIYVQPFPPTGAKYQISQSGAAWPIWSHSGNELFYRLSVFAEQAERMNAVSITTKPFAVTSETALPVRDFSTNRFYRDYDMMPNGKFLAVYPINQTVSREPPRPRFEIVLNWFRELQERVPVK